MRLRLSIVLTVWLLGMFAVSAQAQECDIDLTNAVLQLLQAQTLSSGGDPDGGLAQIAEARAVLAEIVESCREAGLEAGVLLDNEFIAPNGTFVVNYPTDWVEGVFSPNPAGGGVFFGSSPTAASALNSTIPELQPGEQALAIAVGSPALLGEASDDATLADVLRAFTEGSLAQFETVSELELSTFESRQIGRAQFRGDAFEALLVGVELPDSELVAIVVGVSAVGELDALRPVVEAVALSAR